MAFYLKLLGYFEVRCADDPPLALSTRKAHALLAYLATQPGRPISRDTLTALLWPDRGEKQARHSLTQTLYTLRKALDEPDADAFLTDSNTVTLNRAAARSDVATFQRLAAEQDPESLQRAADLYGGDFLEGLVLREEPFMEWLSFERARLHECALSVLMRLMEARTKAGETDPAITVAQRLLALDPLCEQVHRALMSLFAKQGSVPAALRQFRNCTELLRRELGVEPDVETRQLYESIKTQRNAVSSPPPNASPAEPSSTNIPTATADHAGFASKAVREKNQPEHKQATVMAVFVTKDREDAKAFLRDVEDCVKRFGGMLQHRSEREVLALFGAPAALEDHAERACRTALDIAARTSSPAFRISLDSGAVIWRPAATPDSRADLSGTPLIRAIELAQSSAGPRLTATAETRGLARRRILFERAECNPGVSSRNAEAIYTLTGEQLASGVGRWATADPTAFFGREDELEVLDEALSGVGRGHGRAFAITGEPGVGKSRVLHEFIQRHVPAEWSVLHCAGVSHGRDIPYLPFKALLRDYFGIPPQAPSDKVRALIGDGVAAADPSLSVIAPALLSLFDVEDTESGWDALEPVQKRRRIIDAIKALLYRLSVERPLVIAIEDLHWIDTETERVLRSLLDGLPHSRQLMLVNFRPEYRPDWLGRSWVRQLTLGPLSTDSAAKMLDSLLGHESGLTELKRHLIAHTGANPFFLEECVQTLAEKRIISGPRGQRSLHGEPTSIVVPETVQAVIVDRMDRLDVLDKQILQTAAVIGFDVPHALLDRICGVPEEALYAALDHLKDAEFLVEARPPPETAYAFKHALTHGAAYESLLPERRRGLHAKILAALERAPDEQRVDQTEALAHHALRGEIWAKAAEYYAEAGLRAAARSANGAAVAHYDQALSALERLPESTEEIAKEIDLRFDARNALFVLGDHEAIPGHLDRAEELARKIGDMRRVGWARLHLGGFGWQSGQYDAGLDACRAAMDIAERCGDAALGAMARYRTGLNYHGLGRFAEAVTCFENCIAALEKADDATTFALGGIPYVFCRSFLAWSHAELGQFDAANRNGESGWKLAADSNHTYSQMVMAFGWANALLMQDRIDEAAKILNTGLDLYAINEAHATFPWIAAPLGYARVVQGAAELGLDLLRRAVSPLVRQRGVQYARPYLWLSEGLIRLERREEAREAAEAGLAISNSQNEGSHQVWAITLFGDITASDDPAAARTHYETALRLARELELAPRLNRCELALERL